MIISKNENLTKDEFNYIDKFGVGQIDTSDLSIEDIMYIQMLVRKLVNKYPLCLVEGMFDEE